MRHALLITATAAYAAAVILANVLTSHYGLVSAGFGLMVTAGTYAAGAALLARDFVHRAATDRWGTRGYLYLVACILIAGAVSWVLADPFIAAASTIAFLTAETVDLAVFAPLHERAGFAWAALTSNVISAPVDTVVFLAIAGFPLTWQAITGQFIAKVLWATIVPLTVYVIARRVRTRGVTA